MWYALTYAFRRANTHGQCALTTQAATSDAVVGGGAARRSGFAASGAAAADQQQQPPQQQQQQQQQSQQQAPQQQAASRIAGDAVLLRRVAAAKSAVEALDLLLQQHAPGEALDAADAELVLTLALEKGNVDLALAIYSERCASRRGAQRGRAVGAAGAAWPAATLATTAALILGLCRQLRVAEALGVMQGMRTQGLPRTEEVRSDLLWRSSSPRALGGGAMRVNGLG